MSLRKLYPCRGRNCTERMVLSPPHGLCGWCTRELELDAVGVLVALAKDGSGRARSERVDAIDDLGRLGYTNRQVVLARARAHDGHSVEEILEGLAGVEQVGAVA